MNENRLLHIKRIARESSLDSIFISDSISAAYVSGFVSSHQYLLVSARKNLLFTDFRYEEAARLFCKKNSAWRFVLISGTGYSFIDSFVKQGNRVGIQSNTMSLDQYEELRKINRTVRFVKLKDAISRVSMVKTSREIRAMKKAASIADHAYTRFIRKVRVGMTEIAAAIELERLCSHYGSEKPSFDTIVLFGAHAALPHGRPSKRILKKGDWVLVDFGCTVDGFLSDMTRTAVVGRANERQKNIYTVVSQAQRKGTLAVKPGCLASAVDGVTRAVIEDAGYGEAFGHATGHGVGREVHEMPRLNKSDRTVLEQNMVVTVEPGIYLPGFGGVRIEDMVVVTQNGCRSLTRTPRDLLEI